MGCDIHIIAEVKENGVWKKNSEKIFPNSHFKKDSGKIKNVVEPLRLLANKYEDVRLVFAFDN